MRVETGYMDRDQYQIAVLFQPNKRWTTFAPQRQFDHKLLITHGASCGVDYQTGTAPTTTGTPPPRLHWRGASSRCQPPWTTPDTTVICRWRRSPW